MVRLIEADYRDAAEYFSLEYALATRPDAPEFYSFWQTPPTLMLGYNQSAAQEVDLAAVLRRGVAIRRRRSGGGTIYTDGGTLQMTHLIPDSPDLSRQLAVETGRLAAALCKLGIPAEFNDRNDILVDGRKVSGAAGYGCGNRYLYHASLLWEVDPDAVGELLTVDPGKLRRHGIRSVRQRMANLSHFTGLSFGEFAGRLRDELLPPEYETVSPAPTDEAAAREALKRTFGDRDWIMRGDAPDA